MWVPTGGISATENEGMIFSVGFIEQHKQLMDRIRCPCKAYTSWIHPAGQSNLICRHISIYLTEEQSHSGLFQMLPFGLRVQEKIEKLIDGHMQSLGVF